MFWWIFPNSLLDTKDYEKNSNDVHRKRIYTFIPNNRTAKIERQQTVQHTEKSWTKDFISNT